MNSLNYLMGYSVSDIQNYFEYILKTRREKTDNPLIIVYVNKIENRIHLEQIQDIISTFSS